MLLIIKITLESRTHDSCELELSEYYHCYLLLLSSNYVPTGSPCEEYLQEFNLSQTRHYIKANDWSVRGRESA